MKRRRCRQVRGVASAQPALHKTKSVGDGGKRARSPGRARHKPLKPLRAGMPGDSGVLVVTRVRSTTTKCTRDRGCSGHPAFPTPFLGRKINAQLGRIAPRDREVAFGRHCERSEAANRNGFILPVERQGRYLLLQFVSLFVSYFEMNALKLNLLNAKIKLYT